MSNDNDQPDMREVSSLDDSSEHRLLLRSLKLSDFDEVHNIMERVYAGLGGSWTRREFSSQLKRFPDGQICIEDNGKVVAAAFSAIVDYDKFGDRHTYEEITGDYYLTTHDPKGNVLYGVDIFVDPDYHGMRLGRRLYEARKELCKNLNLRSIIAGGRIPGYKAVADTLSPFEYIEKVGKGEIYDPILTFQLANDFEVKQLLPGYLPEDKASKGYATLLIWHNMYFQPQERKLIGRKKTTARIGCVQWQMREHKSVEELLKQFEYFTDALSDYKCDLAVFPEFFCAPLMGLKEHENSVEAIRFLAGFSEQLLEHISKLAVSYNINIVAGSMPVLEDNELYNIAYLCRRDGTIESQYKIHPTPSEKKDWYMQGGEQIKVFDTDFGRIGILICYDSEFPELARLMSDQDVQILVVPFWTDTKNGYLRVRLCSQARAIENECYVAIAGSVGNLPQVDSLDIQYAQSAVFSPSDFAFPHDAIMSETTPNTEMTLIVDLDLSKLEFIRNEGSVRNFLDRRRDLYTVGWVGHKHSQ